MPNGRVTGHQQVLARIARIRERIPATVSDDRVMDFMERRVRDRFLKGVDPEGTPWAPLAASTIARKVRAGSATPSNPLRRTDTLMNSIRAIRAGNAPFQTATGLGFRIGVEDDEAAKYGRLHDQGKGQVQRKFMGVSSRDAKALTDLILREVRKVIRSTK